MTKIKSTGTTRQTHKPVSRKIQKKADPRRADNLSQHSKWLARAEAVANAPVSHGGSPHPTVKVGAVLVDSDGHEIAAASNRFPEGVDRRRPERYANGYKSLWINCAEQMTLMQALAKHAKITGSTLYVTLEPCAVCAGLIAELKVKRVCVPVGAMRRYAKLKSKWKESIEIGMIKLAESGVDMISLDTVPESWATKNK